jgi:hypothetical protein
MARKVPRNQIDQRLAHGVTGSTIRALVEALEKAAYDVRQLGCNCATNAELNAEHAKSERQTTCTGHARASVYEALCKRIRRRTGTQEPAPLTGVLSARQQHLAELRDLARCIAERAELDGGTPTTFDYRRDTGRDLAEDAARMATLVQALDQDDRPTGGQ